LIVRLKYQTNLYFNYHVTAEINIPVYEVLSCAVFQNPKLY